MTRTSRTLRRLGLWAGTMILILAIASSCANRVSFGQHASPEVQFMLAVGQLGPRTIAVGNLPFAYDWKGRVIKVGADWVTYKTGHLAQIGTAVIRYNDRDQLIQVGDLPVQYSPEPRIIGLGDAAIVYNDIGHILRIGSLPLQYDEQNRVSWLGSMAVRYGPTLDPAA